ncbi:nuclear transport factor 2 family protein [Flagellimonas sp.]|uniref:nuclear transport factor 2 family protein n=1 Tax=Flagellimonas sp. TaxID=2058762 RepID=UPI003F49E089
MGLIQRISFVVFLILSFAIQAQTETKNKVHLVEALSEAYRKAILEENLEAVIQMLHSEVMFYPPSGKAFSGKDTVGKLIVSFLEKNDVTSWTVNVDRCADLGDSLFEFGHFEILENEETSSKRKYLNIWAREKGEYKLFFRGWSPL